MIARLQIAVSKVALADKSFFGDKDHPARRLLDHLAQSALGWVDDGDRSPDSVYGRIERVVEQILADQGRDPTVFSRLDMAFSQHLARERELARTAEQKARREFEEMEHKRGHQALVRRAIDERLQAYADVPEVVASLVNDGWRLVMEAALREDGVTGSAWCTATATLDRLLWSVQPKIGDQERRELLRGIPELLRTLRQSLAAVSYDQSRLAAKFRELQTLHIAALRRPETETDGLSAVPGQGAARARITPDGRLGPSGSDPASMVRHRWGRLTAPVVEIADLREGTWIELRRGGAVQRVKLSRTVEASGTHLFVNRHGQKALQLTSEGIAVIVGDGESSVVDRAMDNLVHLLKSA
jgi:hypothetical protein